jgi:hypothetical protein
VGVLEGKEVLARQAWFWVSWRAVASEKELRDLRHERALGGLAEEVQRSAFVWAWRLSEAGEDDSRAGVVTRAFRAGSTRSSLGFEAAFATAAQ